ncbi:hypothetical protein HZS_3346 [Henneguya salminicola]|nr:hypothetical protein HZS_3346 [Henneguya salminicola]
MSEIFINHYYNGNINYCDVCLVDNNGLINCVYKKTCEMPLCKIFVPENNSCCKVRCISFQTGGFYGSMDILVFIMCSAIILFLFSLIVFWLAKKLYISTESIGAESEVINEELPIDQGAFPTSLPIYISQEINISGELPPYSQNNETPPPYNEYH